MPIMLIPRVRKARESQTGLISARVYVANLHSISARWCFPTKLLIASQHKVSTSAFLSPILATHPCATKKFEHKQSPSPSLLPCQPFQLERVFRIGYRTFTVRHVQHFPPPGWLKTFHDITDFAPYRPTWHNHSCRTSNRCDMKHTAWPRHCT